MTYGWYLQNTADFDILVLHLAILLNATSSDGLSFGGISMDTVCHL